VQPTTNYRPTWADPQWASSHPALLGLYTGVVTGIWAISMTREIGSGVLVGLAFGLLQAWVWTSGRGLRWSERLSARSTHKHR
jgi:hypothetical protein